MSSFFLLYLPRFLMVQYVISKTILIECTTKKDWDCVFPFIEHENDTEHNKCAWFEDEHTFRCATEIDEYNVWTKHGDCMYKCPLEGKNLSQIIY